MKLVRIIYLDSFIKIFFVKTDKKELDTITLAFVNNITLSYSIRLINSPGRKVTEQVKINNDNLSFIDNFMVISFYITDLHSPENCELSLHTLNIHFNDSPTLKMKINKTHTFKSIQSATAPIISKTSKLITRPKQKQKKKVHIKSTTKEKTEIMTKEEDNSQPQFTDSFEKFKDRIQGTNLLDLLKKKTDSVDFNLKNFGISLLCKLLLLVTYVNQIVDNEFQHDLQEFMRTNILKSIEEEVSA